MFSIHKSTDAKLLARGWFPVLEENLDILARKMLACCWSPLVYKFGVRREVSFWGADYCALDFDEGMTLEQAVDNIFADTVCVIGTTKSHRKEKSGKVADRFRVVIPFESRIKDAEHYKQNMSKIAKKYDSDLHCVDAARFYFPCTKIIRIQKEGYRQDVIEKTETGEPENIQAAISKNENRAKRSLPKLIRAYLEHGCDDGKRNHTCFVVANCMYENGYSKNEITDAIVNSPIPRYNSKEKTYDAFLKEIDEAVSNGIKRAITRKGNSVNGK